MTDAYREWTRGFHGDAFLRRSAERNAAFLLPRLAPGQRVVDIGCGPGAITVGLADRVVPGEVIGIDSDADFIADATQRWSRPNLLFEQADGAALPLDTGACDIAFLHAVLQHVESPTAVLSEVRRVVRGGGVVGIADADLDGFLIHPQTEELTAALALDRRTRRNPEIGRQLRELLLDAGFGDVEFTVVANVVSGDATVGAGAAAAARLEAEPFITHVEDQEWVTRAQLAEMADAWRTWGAMPGAIFVTLWCQALAS